MMGARLELCRLLDLPRLDNPRGSLTFIEAEVHVPFPIRRVYWLYDVPNGATRAGHAHRNLHQVLIAMSGSFDVGLDDGRQQRRVRLKRSHQGLYVPPLIWR
jgi:hypothetical protein